MTMRAKVQSTPRHLRPHEQALAAPRWLAALPLVPVLLSLQSVAAVAGPCLAPNQKLLPVPEIRSNKGVLRGTILLTSEQRRLIFRAPGTIPGQPGIDCQPQRVRAFIGLEATPKVPPSPGGIIDPYPGPTLRARLGDVVQLTFVNQIDANRFPYSIDRGEKLVSIAQDPASGCDVSSPGNPQLGYPLLGGDAFPDCFHGSSTGNLHFHGTHTNPDTTADNVLLEIRPSPLDQKTRGSVDHAGERQQILRGFLQALRSRAAQGRVLDLSDHLERGTAGALHQAGHLDQPADGTAAGLRQADRPGPLAGERADHRDEQMAAILHRRLPLLFRDPGIQGTDVAAAPRQQVADHGPVAGHALVSRAQARLDRDQCRERHDRRVHHRRRL